MTSLARKWLYVAGFLAISVLMAWKFLPRETPAASLPQASARPEEIIPPGIIVSEFSPTIPLPVLNIPQGDRVLHEYANSALPPQNDMILMAQVITSFLTIFKQAANFPLSANEEWSAALLGRRTGAEAWISENQPVLDRQGRLIDRWKTPLHFHALGNRQWEIRSAGPDRKLWSADDLLQKTTG